jgi:gluconolactonase
MRLSLPGRGLAASLSVVALLSLTACGDVDTGPRTLPDPAPPAVAEVTGLDGPEGLCFDRAGDLWIGSQSGRLVRVSPSGETTVAGEVGGQLAGLAATPEGDVLAAMFAAGKVVRVARDGSQTVVASGLDNPNGIALDARGRILVSASGFGGRPQIAIVDEGGQRTLTDRVVSPNGIAFGPDGRLYVAETLQNRVVVLDYDADDGSAGAPEVFATGTLLADGIAFDVNGDLFVTGAGQVWLVPAGASGPPRPYVVEGDLAGPASLAFGAGRGRDRGRLWFTNYGFPALGTGTSVASVPLGVPGLPLLP